MAGTPTYVLWTWREGKLYPSKGAAEDRLKEWKAEYEERGWSVTGSVSGGSLIAYAPDYVIEEHWKLPSRESPYPNPRVHACAMRSETTRVVLDLADGTSRRSDDPGDPNA